MVVKYSVDKKYFSHLSQKTGFDISCKLSHLAIFSTLIKMKFIVIISSVYVIYFGQIFSGTDETSEKLDIPLPHTKSDNKEEEQFRRFFYSVSGEVNMFFYTVSGEVNIYRFAADTVVTSKIDDIKSAILVLKYEPKLYYPLMYFKTAG